MLVDAFDRSRASVPHLVVVGSRVELGCDNDSVGCPRSRLTQMYKTIETHIARGRLSLKQCSAD